MVLPVAAQADWASDMFKDTSHNFGMVARGADTRFSFVFTNKYEEDVVIESVRSTCRCTQPTFKPGVIKTWQQGQIDIQLDTRNFYGRKDATVTVRFSKPYPVEVQLHSFCFIRTDVYVEPGNVAFGTVQQGQTRQQTFRVNYAGRTYWQSWAITDIQSESSFYKASMREVQRNYNYVSYDITLTLKENAPEGYLNDFIDIISNDPNPSNQHCPVPVNGYILASVTAKPSPLSFGIVPGGQQATKTVVLSGQQPFAVKSFTCSDPRITAKISPATKNVHIIPVTIVNSGTDGKFSGALSFEVSSQAAPINLPYSGQLLPMPQAVKPPVLTPEKIEAADDLPEETVVETPAAARELTPAEKFFPPKTNKTNKSKQPSASKPADSGWKSENLNKEPAVKQSEESAPEIEISAPADVQKKKTAAPVELPAVEETPEETALENTEQNAMEELPAPVELEAPQQLDEIELPTAE